MSFWGRYIPVAERQAKAQKQLKKLMKQGRHVMPVVLEGRTIAHSFWGRGWCDHLESFSDYENRLPRGRAYVRNGSVCHLEILPGRIESMVAGSSLYSVTISIDPLPESDWKSITLKCSGQIGSMLELLQGKLSHEVMSIVSDPDDGLFPQPGEIDFRCSCPDDAEMCKHVAAVLYGVGSRLDTQPELLFQLRNVDAQELISAGVALPAEAAGADETTIASDRLADIFGIELEDSVITPLADPRTTMAATKPKLRLKQPRKKKAIPGKTKDEQFPFGAGQHKASNILPFRKRKPTPKAKAAPRKRK